MKALSASRIVGSTDIIGLGLSAFSGRVGFLASDMLLLESNSDADHPEHKLNGEKDISNLKEDN